MQRLARGVYSYIPIAVVVGLAIVVRAESWLDTDVSNLITLAQRFVGGAKPYVDFPEVNPPASILLYVPGVFAGNWFGVTPEAALSALVFAAVAVSLLLVTKILEGASLMQRWERFVLLPAACGILLILPEDAFAQREHIALIAFLPILATYAVRSSDQSVDPQLAIVAGIFGGVGSSIKPHFGFALLLPVIYSVWTSRHKPKARAKILFSPENIAAALVILLYSAVLFFAFPEYLSTMLPVVTSIYAPARLPWATLLRTWSVVLVVQGLIGAAIIGLKVSMRPFPFVFLLAALGFLTAAMIQGKGWPYHGYPSTALMLIVLCAGATKRWPEIKASRPSTRTPWIASSVVLVFGLYATASMSFWPPTWYPSYVAAVAHYSPAHPKIATVCGGPELAYPLVRILRGTQIGGELGLNMAVIRLEVSGGLEPARQRLFEHYARGERASLARAIDSGRPDVVIVAKGLAQWASDQPELAAALRKFHRVQNLETAEIWLPD